ncbi:PrpF domain-containing protein [Microbulbifer sp. TB1203]|uniref:PrpF domain-containing protein n=1 Tax=Microbulbifer sp. TB1203 TaxID=3021712 RepID=UPI0027E550AE|nr:PrpF domain-containing protein [Microbulbifer sp. TB1203]
MFRLPVKDTIVKGLGARLASLRVEAEVANGQWTATKAIMSRSARILMEGWVRVPGDSF